MLSFSGPIASGNARANTLERRTHQRLPLLALLAEPLGAPLDIPQVFSQSKLYII